MVDLTDNNSHDDDQLVERAKIDVRYFDILYEKYFKKIYLFIYKRTFDEALSGELCSNVFYIAMCNIKIYKNQGFPFSSWLFKIASNELNGYYRKQKNAERHIHIESEHIVSIIEEYDIDKEEVLQKIELHIASLSGEEIQILELRFFEKRAFKEIGYLLNITADNAKIKTYRIIDKLKSIFKNER